MSLKDELSALRAEALAEQKIKFEDLLKRQEEATRNFFITVMNRLKKQFNLGPTASAISLSLSSSGPGEDPITIQNLYKENLLNEAYLKSLCEQEGIMLSILKEDSWYPSLTFTINFCEPKERKIR